MIALARSKYRVRGSRTSSESRSSANGVKPTRSAKRTETSRRSAVVLEGVAAPPFAAFPAPAGAAGGLVALPAAASPGPQLAQKRWSGRIEAPQLGQPAATGVPHSAQKRWSAWSAEPQFVHASPAMRG